MKEKDEMLAALRNLALDRTAARLMREDIARIEEDIKKELPEVQREALEKERLKLLSCAVVTEHHIERTDRLLALLTPEEQKIVDQMLIHPHPEAAFDLAFELAYEPCSIYRIRARAISKLIRLRYGAGQIT